MPLIAARARGPGWSDSVSAPMYWPMPACWMGRRGLDPLGVRARLHEPLSRATRIPMLSILWMTRGLVTSAGTAAGLDCCLSIWCGSTTARLIANKVARRLVIPPLPGRRGQPSLSSSRFPLPPAIPRMNQLLDHLRAHLAEPHTLDTLAANTPMSRRTFYPPLSSGHWSFGR